jgi:dihydrofolate reductase
MSIYGWDGKWKISIVAAYSKDTKVIGAKGKLPWGKCSKDLKKFKDITTGKLYGGDSCVIMGRKTYDTIGAPLPDRTNIIMTTNLKYIPPNGVNANLIMCYNMDEVFSYLEINNIYKPFVIGGGEIYSIFIPYCDRMYITEFNEKYEGDRIFPRVLPKSWDIEEVCEDEQSNDLYKNYIWRRNPC